MAPAAGDEDEEGAAAERPIVEGTAFGFDGGVGGSGGRHGWGRGWMS